MLVWLVSSLGEIASAVDGASNLEEVTVHFDSPSSQMDEAPYVLHTRISVWKDLDTLLASSPRFSNLRKFKIYVCHVSDVLEDIERLFRVWISGLSKKERVS
jgi:hypothetical protein